MSNGDAIVLIAYQAFCVMLMIICMVLQSLTLLSCLSRIEEKIDNIQIIQPPVLENIEENE